MKRDLKRVPLIDLDEIAKNDDIDTEIRIEAIGIIYNPSLLKKLYYCDSNPKIRKACRKRLDETCMTDSEILFYLDDLGEVDDDILLEIALTDSTYFSDAGWSIAGIEPAVKYGYPNRCMALSKMKKEETFVKFAKEIDTEIEFPEFEEEVPEADSGFPSLNVNVMRYADYVRASREEHLEEMCIYAIGNVSSEDALCDIALNAKFWISRILAIERIFDKDVLEEISNSDFYEDVRLAAKRRMDEVMK